MVFSITFSGFYSFEVFCDSIFLEMAGIWGIQSEYAVGVLVAMMVGQNLIASALGLASGLTEALLTLGKIIGCGFSNLLNTDLPHLFKGHT